MRTDPPDPILVELNIITRPIWEKYPAEVWVVLKVFVPYSEIERKSIVQFDHDSLSRTIVLEFNLRQCILSLHKVHFNNTFFDKKHVLQ